jgi:hypothetical protein
MQARINSERCLIPRLQQNRGYMKQERLEEWFKSG